jgi:hypothetical protein
MLHTSVPTEYISLEEYGEREVETNKKVNAWSNDLEWLLVLVVLVAQKKKGKIEREITKKKKKYYDFF